MFNLPPPPGFQGLCEHLPLKVYEQLLPHWRQGNATYFVTFRLDDSLPEAKLRELRGLKAEWQRKHPPPRSKETLEQLVRDLGTRIEHWLDEGHGSCLLNRAELARCVVTAMNIGHGTIHELGCFVIMPNHVHAVVRPLVPVEKPLEEVCRLWKGRSAREINLIRQASGTLWQRESYDRIIRDAEHLWQVIQYIGRNPTKANLPADSVAMWINPAWIELGWRFIDQ
jgi:REP element-mobilizing transposase RayT